MSAQDVIVNAVHPDRELTYRVGGIASLAIGVIYVVIIGLYASVGVPPEGGEERLNYFSGKTTLWWAIVGLSVLTNFLYMPVSLSLYSALKSVNQFAMLIGVAFVGLFVVLENAAEEAADGIPPVCRFQRGKLSHGTGFTTGAMYGCPRNNKFLNHMDIQPCT